MIPVGKFLPEMYIDHPQNDIRNIYKKCLNAFALKDDIELEIPKEFADRDTKLSEFF